MAGDCSISEKIGFASLSLPYIFAWLPSSLLKATVVLDASQLAGFEVPNGQPRVAFTIDVGGHAITGEFNSKSLRRVVTAIAEHGTEGIAVIAQGRLVGDALEDAGIVAQPKTPKVSESAREKPLAV